MNEIVSNIFNININKELENTQKEIVSNSFYININKSHTEPIEPDVPITPPAKTPVKPPVIINDDVFESVELITDEAIKKGKFTRVAIRLKSKKDLEKNKVINAAISHSNLTIKNVQFEQGSVLTDYRTSVYHISKKASEIKVELDKITSTVKKIDGDYATSSQVEQTANDLQIKFQESGGYNLIYNGDFRRNDASWTVNNRANMIFSQSGFSCPNGRGVKMTGKLNTLTSISQYVSNVGQISESITVSYYTYVSSSGADGTTNAYRAGEVTLGYTDGTNTWHSLGNVSKFDTWEKKSITVKPTKRVNSIRIGLYNRDTTRVVYYSAVMIEKGSLANDWSPNPNELYDGITTIDKDGVTITASNVKSKTNMDANGFRITKTDTNEDVFKVNSDGTLFMKGNITVTGGSLDASKVNVTNLNANNITSGLINANRIDVNNLKVNGSLISGQINGVGGIKFADGAIISSYDSHVPGHKGIRVSAPSIKLGDRVDIHSAIMYGDVVGRNNTSSATTTWTMSSAGALTCASASLSKTLNVNGVIYGMNNLALARGSLYVPIFGSSSNFDYIKGGRGTIAFADTGPIHFLYNGTKSSFIAGGSVFLPHAGNVDCDHFRLGAGIMASPSSGSFHFLTANGATSPLYAGILYSATRMSLDEPMVVSSNSVFDKINSIDVIETKDGLRLYNPIPTTKAIDKSTEVVKTEYDEDKNEINTSIDYTSAIATLWKAVQELKQENNELKEIIKDIYSKL